MVDCGNVDVECMYRPGGEEPVEDGGEDGELGGAAGHPHVLHHRPHANHRIHLAAVVHRNYITDRPVPQRTDFHYFRRNLH